MSQNSAQDKTEEASSQKRQKARDEGQIARSKELSSAGLLLLGGLALVVAAKRLMLRKQR